MQSVVRCAAPAKQALGIPTHNAAQAEYDRSAALLISAGPSNPQQSYVCAGHAKVHEINWAGLKIFSGPVGSSDRARAVRHARPSGQQSRDLSQLKSKLDAGSAAAQHPGNAARPTT